MKIKNINFVYLNVLFLSIITLVESLTDCDSLRDRDFKKLQIGIKRRPEICNYKSKKGDLLHIKYKGIFENGNVFDSSGDSTFTFTLGSDQVIKGWNQGLMGMCVTELRKLVIPPHLAYGFKGVPPRIPPDTTLIFQIDLVDIEKSDSF